MRRLVDVSTISRNELEQWARNRVITTRRLEALGLTRAEIRTLERRQLLHRAHVGTYFLDARPPRLAEWTAAVVACVDGTLLCGRSGAVLWGLTSSDAGRPHVLLPTRAGRAPSGVRAHRTRRPAARAVVTGVPVTSLTRTIEDCSATMTPHAIKRMLRQAEHHHALDLSLLGDTRCRRLREVLRRYVPGQGMTDSELEAAFFELSHRAGLPAPLLQRPMPGGRADFVYEELKLIVEVDGYDVHRGRVAFQEDRARDRANRRRGYETVRFTWADVTATPDEVVDDLRHALRPRPKGR